MVGWKCEDQEMEKGRGQEVVEWEWSGYSSDDDNAT